MVARGQMLLHSQPGGAWAQLAQQQQRQQQPAARPSLADHLAGCRTKKTDPIPLVNTSAWRATVAAWNDDERATADRFSTAVGACDSFACLQRANELVRAWPGGGACGSAG